MKKICYTLLIAAAAYAGACSKDDEYVIYDYEKGITATAEQIRAGLVGEWVTADAAAAFGKEISFTDNIFSFTDDNKKIEGVYEINISYTECLFCHGNTCIFINCVSRSILTIGTTTYKRKK
ncbi:MAG: hypothetical protein LBT48_01425 [Prevotellaceae bacterium]|jgi:hypothetical protein|nr:hypothetical protein [Prevotellaceae bacterium]